MSNPLPRPCLGCGAALRGRQVRYCSDRCRALCWQSDHPRIDQATTEQLELELESRQRRDDGIAAVSEADPEWIEDILEVIAILATYPNRPITSDDVREVALDAGIPEPHHPNAWGAAMRTAALRGIIEPTDRTVKSSRPAAHRRRLVVWRAKR